ncbi:hypothetical protein R8Z50_15245 [Longispora sp. K20-0274]|uniref:hypothetical protein n=1 Tax=Longispora sp. K20-0274 TaxID=3088255 RepID=UPI00399A7B73
MSATMSCSTEQAEWLRRVIWQEARPGDGLEHVYVEPTVEGADAVVFVVASTLSEAERAAADLIERAVLRGGYDGWRVLLCEVSLIIPFARQSVLPDE